jgi:CPA1 family monovalent cation:H+ antiporter
VALLLSVTGIFAYLNHRFLKLPLSVGVMALALAFSLLCILGEQLGLPLRGWASNTVAHVNFSEALLDGMLSFMLFAGALHVDLDELREQRMTVAVLATVGVLISTALVGVATWFVFRYLDLHIPFLACLTFGALISPTDPIAVMELLKHMKVSKSLSTKIAGESLFNDGVGIVIFLLVFRMWSSGSATIPWQHTLRLLAQEVGGGLLLGLLLGIACYYLLLTVDNYQVELMLTISLVSGGYQLATTLHASGALAIVVAGLIIGNYGRKYAMSEHTRVNLDVFWETIDEVLNGILFVLIGLEVLVLDLKPAYIIASLCVIPLVLLARLISLALPINAITALRMASTPISVLTWGGLRGGISIALALSLPTGHIREVLLVATYAAVAFSILVQATTMPRLLRTVLVPITEDDIKPRVAHDAA